MVMDDFLLVVEQYQKYFLIQQFHSTNVEEFVRQEVQPTDSRIFINEVIEQMSQTRGCPSVKGVSLYLINLEDMCWLPQFRSIPCSSTPCKYVPSHQVHAPQVWRIQRPGSECQKKAYNSVSELLASGNELYTWIMLLSE